jgi:hypothetical protein
MAMASLKRIKTTPRIGVAEGRSHIEPIKAEKSKSARIFIW